MAARYVLPVVLCIISIASGQGLQTVDGRIKVTIGTTSGCGDTVRFISNDLAEAYALYGEFLDIEFIPWGRTRREEDGSLVCQFGVNDCWANRLHRCALNMLKGNQAAQMHYMNCEFSSPYPSYMLGSYLCAQAVGLSIVDIDYCVANLEDEIDFEAERIGSHLTQVTNFIPSLGFNDEVDKDLHDEAFQRFTSLVCFALAADPTTGVTDCSL